MDEKITLAEGPPKHGDQYEGEEDKSEQYLCGVHISSIPYLDKHFKISKTPD